MPAAPSPWRAPASDIWGTSDQFRFVYQPIDGDGEVVARVASVLNTDVWAKGGVMIREDLTANAPNAMALVSAGQGFTFQRRVTRGDASTFNGGFGGMAPQWVRLVRSGTTISGYYSPTGTNWIWMGSESIPMPTRVYVGLAVTSHNTALINNVTLTNVTVTGGSPSPPPPKYLDALPHVRKRGHPGHHHGREFWRHARDEHGAIQRDRRNADELERHQHRRARAERRDDRQRRGDRRRRGQQRGALSNHRPVRIAGALEFARHRRARARRQRHLRGWHLLRGGRRRRHLGHQRSVSLRLSAD